MLSNTYSTIREKETTDKKGDNVSKILISCDINCSRITEHMYNTMLLELANNNTDTHIHIYNYLPKKHTFITGAYNEITHAYNGSHKRVALDLTQALDTMKLALQDNFDMIYLITGEYESETLYSKLSEINTPCTKVIVTACSISTICKNGCKNNGTTSTYIQHNEVNSSTVTDIITPTSNNSVVGGKQLETISPKALVSIEELDRNTHYIKDDIINSSQETPPNAVITSSNNENNSSNHIDISLLHALPPDTLRVLLQYILNKKSKNQAV